MAALKIEDVRTFLCVAEAGGFTSAGVLLGATQSAVSVRIRKLEDQLGLKLLDRTPRDVRLTADGAMFVDEARRLVDVHDAVVRRARADMAPLRLSLGISDHAAGARLPRVLATLSRAMPEVRFHVEVGASEDLLAKFEDRAFDAAILRGPPERLRATLLFEESSAWFAASHLRLRRSDPLPLIARSYGCRLRDGAIEALDHAGRPWTEVLVGGSVATVRAAVTAGLGVACLGRQNAPDESRDVGAELGLPSMSPAPVALVHRLPSALSPSIVNAMVDSFRARPGRGVA